MTETLAYRLDHFDTMSTEERIATFQEYWGDLTSMDGATLIKIHGDAVANQAYTQARWDRWARISPATDAERADKRRYMLARLHAQASVQVVRAEVLRRVS